MDDQRKILSGRPGRPRKKYQSLIDHRVEDVKVDVEAVNNEDFRIGKIFLSRTTTVKTSIIEARTQMLNDLMLS